MMFWLLLIGLLLLFFSGAPLFAVMLGATAIGAIALPRDFTAEFGGPLSSIYGLGTKDEAIIFATIPLFIYAGYVMAAARTSDRLVRFANALLGWMPGGLAIVTIVACAIFTIFTGASGVTIVALGGLLMPALVKQKYPERFALGLVTGTGSVGLLFPPAVPLFVFGTVYGLQRELADKNGWETERFLGAGIVPGLVLIGCLSIVAVVAAILWKVPRQKFKLGELGRSSLAALPELIIPFGIILILAKGWANVAQIAALTVVYLLVLEMLIYRDFKPKTLWHISTESLALVGTIFLVIYTASAFSNLLVTARVPQDLVLWTKEHIHSKVTFLLLLNVLLLLVGMMMDIFSAIIIVLPLIAGVADQYGVNPYHLGVIFLLNLEIGYLTPPVGLNLFISSFKFQRPVIEVTKATLPFIGAMLVALILVTYIPALTWVPPPKRTGNLGGLNALVQEGVQTVGSVDCVKLGDGTKMCKKDCDKKYAADESMKESCYGVMIDVTDCRKKPADEAKACEAEVIADWIEYSTPVDDDDDEDSDSADKPGAVDDADDDSADDDSDDDSGDDDSADSADDDSGDDDSADDAPAAAPADAGAAAGSAAPGGAAAGSAATP
ncbi:MAG: TRAP transporter large permease [Kofleriaceae bacterium]|nr:TRAP transporter large permease [Kofleriaceae bacterium]MCB9574861.1 TRAP transporter large permease [Kofleriaceae bacterium]